MDQLVERMNKKAIVIGATSGIGREVALQLVEKGWLVGIAGRRTDLLREVQRQAPEGRIACFRQIDIIKDDASDLLQEMISEMGGMDLYFHSSDNTILSFRLLKFLHQIHIFGNNLILCSILHT